MSSSPSSPTEEDVTTFEQRKKDHIQWSLNKATQTENLSQFDYISLEHEAFPEIDFAQIDLSSESLGTTLASPFFVSSMTAGHEQAQTINRNLAAACSKSAWWFGVGSQRRELYDRAEAKKWESILKDFPTVKVMGNIGLSQLIQTKKSDIKTLIDNTGASAFIVHTNPLQESLQLEGTPNFKGGLQAIENLASSVSVPIVVKETGCGFSSQSLLRLNEVGIQALDISGLGGTHWGRLEGFRLPKEHPKHLAAMAFKDWGIPTIETLLTAQKLNLNYEVWASGGVRNGLHALKCMALGARRVGIAQPMMAAALESSEAVLKSMKQFELELKIGMFVTGASSVSLINNIGYRYESR